MANEIKAPDSHSDKFEFVPGTYDPETNTWQIKAKRSFGDVQAGDLGGCINADSTISNEGNCWVYPGSYVTNSDLKGNAAVRGQSRIKTCVLADEAAVVDSRVFNSQVYGKAEILDKSILRHLNLDGNFKFKRSYIEGSAFNLNKQGMHRESNDKFLQCSNQIVFDQCALYAKNRDWAEDLNAKFKDHAENLTFTGLRSAYFNPKFLTEQCGMDDLKYGKYAAFGTWDGKNLEEIEKVFPCLKDHLLCNDVLIPVEHLNFAAGADQDLADLMHPHLKVYAYSDKTQGELEEVDILASERLHDIFKKYSSSEERLAARKEADQIIKNDFRKIFDENPQAAASVLDNSKLVVTKADSAELQEFLGKVPTVESPAEVKGAQEQTEFFKTAYTAGSQLKDSEPDQKLEFQVVSTVQERSTARERSPIISVNISIDLGEAARRSRNAVHFVGNVFKTAGKTMLEASRTAAGATVNVTRKSAWKFMELYVGALQTMVKPAVMFLKGTKSVLERMSSAAEQVDQAFSDARAECREAADAVKIMPERKVQAQETAAVQTAAQPAVQMSVQTESADLKTSEDAAAAKSAAKAEPQRQQIMRVQQENALLKAKLEQMTAMLDSRNSVLVMPNNEQEAAALAALPNTFHNKRLGIFDIDVNAAAVLGEKGLALNFFRSPTDLVLGKALSQDEKAQLLQLNKVQIHEQRNEAVHDMPKVQAAGGKRR